MKKKKILIKLFFNFLKEQDLFLSVRTNNRRLAELNYNIELIIRLGLSSPQGRDVLSRLFIHVIGGNGVIHGCSDIYITSNTWRIYLLHHIEDLVHGFSCIEKDIAQYIIRRIRLNKCTKEIIRELNPIEQKYGLPLTQRYFINNK